MTLIKICGNTTLDDARAAAEAGADMLGFIFYPPSPRAVTPERAAEIVAALRAERGDGTPLMVGVFVDEPVERVREIMDMATLDAAQLHGSEPPLELRQLAPRAFKAIRPQNRGDAEALLATYAAAMPDTPTLPQLLVDGYHPWKMGGTGRTVPPALARALATRYRLLLAGGLTPETVADAIRDVRPWGVDVASGVESAPGVKDHAALRAFIAAARAADAP